MAQRRRVVDPVADHRDLRCPAAWSARTRSALSAGRTSATTWSAAIPAASAIAAACAPMVAGDHPRGSRPRAAQMPPPRRRPLASSASARVMRPSEGPVVARRRMDVPPRAAAACDGHLRAPLYLDAVARQGAPASRRARWRPSTTAVAPRPAMAWEVVRGCRESEHVDPRAARTTATPEWVLGCQARRSPRAGSSSSSPMPATGVELGEGRLGRRSACRSCRARWCRLSARLLERLAATDEDPRARRRHPCRP